MSRPATVEFVRVVGIDVAFIPIAAGEFSMGSTAGLPAETPVHRVTINRAFLISQTLVTQQLWEAVMGENPSAFRCEPDLAVDSANWYMAIEFCKRISEKIGRAVRLPTEAEWEYACRAGTTSEFHFGDSESVVGDFAWYDRNSDERTHLVATKKPNLWGVFDMTGNLWEWCEDVWHSDYDGAPTDGSAFMDGADRQPRRCLRGCAWNMDAYRCRSAYRSFDWGELGTNKHGVRIVIDVECK